MEPRKCLSGFQNEGGGKKSEVGSYKDKVKESTRLAVKEVMRVG